MKFRMAALTDAAILAAMNQQLIRDEGHRNPMDLAQLTNRMSDWLANGYRAVLFDDEPQIVGYALYRLDPQYVYIRQLFVIAEHRRKGIAKAAIDWSWQNLWRDSQRLRIDVLINNAGARAFWKSIGFEDYCVTMEAVRNQ